MSLWRRARRRAKPLRCRRVPPRRPECTPLLGSRQLAEGFFTPRRPLKGAPARRDPEQLQLAALLVLSGRAPTWIQRLDDDRRLLAPDSASCLRSLASAPSGEARPGRHNQDASG